MGQLMKNISKCKDNVNRDWFYITISDRFSRIQREEMKSKRSEIAASEIILLYSFYMNMLRERKESVKEIARDYYYDSQFIKRTGLLISEEVESYYNYQNNESIQIKLLNILPKNGLEEEEERDITYTGLAIHDLSNDSLRKPEKAREYLLSALRSIE
jgi:hypothetical protein